MVIHRCPLNFNVQNIKNPDGLKPSGFFYDTAITKSGILIRDEYSYS